MRHFRSGMGMRISFHLSPKFCIYGVAGVRKEEWKLGRMKLRCCAKSMGIRAKLYLAADHPCRALCAVITALACAGLHHASQGAVDPRLAWPGGHRSGPGLL